MSDKMPELPVPVGDVLVYDPAHQMTRLEQAHGEYFTEAQLQSYAEAHAQQWREIARKLYVELFYCDQQMTSGPRPKFRTGTSVRSALETAKAALEAARDYDEVNAAIDAARAAREGGDED